MISITKLVCGTAVALISSPRVFAVDEDWRVIQYQVCKPWKLFFLMYAGADALTVQFTPDQSVGTQFQSDVDVASLR